MKRQHSVLHLITDHMLRANAISEGRANTIRRLLCKVAGLKAERDELAAQVHTCPQCGTPCKECRCVEARIAEMEGEIARLGKSLAYEHAKSLGLQEQNVAMGNNRATIVRLSTELDRVPKTRDGVPVVAGMPVFGAWDGEGRVMATMVGGADIQQAVGQVFRSYCDLSSTREAADAAGMTT